MHPTRSPPVFLSPRKAGAARPRLGIAVTTYNRGSVVQELLDALATTTTCGYDLIVCDDGSTDGTVDLVRSRGVRVIAGANRGIAWNKNRGLYYLLAYTASEVVLLLDDDVLPTCVGWEQEWLAAALRFGHINLAHPEIPEALLGGNCTADEPGVATLIPGVCIASTRQALTEVGFMDTRFHGYGHEHVEYTLRFLRAGYGGALWQRESGELSAYYYVISSGLVLRDVPAVSDYRNEPANRALSLALRTEELYRHAWRTAEERAQILAEIRAVAPDGRSAVVIPPGFDDATYLELNPDVALAGFGALYHYVAHGAREGRRWRRTES
jgi:hypothetical protein